jgi:hypothetical protein
MGTAATSQGTAPAFPESRTAQSGPDNARVQARLMIQNQVRQLDRAGMLTPEPAFLGDRVGFDWHQVQVRRQDRDWVLASGGMILGNFGSNESEARQALRALEYYRFTEQRRVGSPNPVLAYFTTSGQTPRGSYFGVPMVSFHPEALSVRAFGGAWAICDDTRVILSLHGRVEDAQQVLQIIQQQRYDGLCQLGSTTATPLAYFVRSH